MNKLLTLAMCCAWWSSNVQASAMLAHDVFKLVSIGWLPAANITRHLHYLVETEALPELHGAVVLRDKVRLQQLIQAGADVNEQSEEYAWSPLHIATLIDDPAAIETLLAAGAKADVVDVNDNSPAEVAALWGNTIALRTLLDTVGVLPPPENHGTGEILLHHAVLGDNIATVTYLLDRGDFAVDETDRRGLTPVMNARSVAMAELLVNAGADLNKTEEMMDFSAAHYATYAGNSKLLKFFLQCSPNLLSRDSCLGTPFLIASLYGYTDMSIDLLARGANVDDKNRWGNNVLQVIVQGEPVNYELFVHLLDKVADINATNMYGQSIAHSLVAQNDAGLFELLLQRPSVKLDVADFQGFTPLHHAAMMDKNISASILVQNGAQLTLKNKEKLTPFLLAVQRLAVATVAVLLEKGSAKQLQHRDAQGNNALHVLVDSYLNPRFISDAEKFNEILALLVKHGLDINSTDTQGNSILHKVAMAEAAELYGFILEHGGDYELKNAEGKTPLELAKNKWPVDKQE